jgi:hypothetical protein
MVLTKLKLNKVLRSFLVTLVFQCGKITTAIINVVLSEEEANITGNCSNRIKNTGKK